MGFVRCRQSADATRIIVNIVHHAEGTRTPSLLLSIDAEKAFYRAHWQYISMVLSKFGFQGPILSSILALYSSPTARVYTSGFLSKPFSISNGTRQGFPLSSSIFNPMIEPLVETSGSHSLTTGFKFNFRCD